MEAFEIRTSTFTEVLEIEKLIPEFTEQTSIKDFKKRTSNSKFLIIILTVNSQPVGYKVGYAKNETEFYSWLGAVIPEFRGRGYAQALLEYQENWARSNNFQLISVKTSQDYPEMLRKLVKNNYQIRPNLASKISRKLEFTKNLVFSGVMQQLCKINS